jgi:hypothetical protein
VENLENVSFVTLMDWLAKHTEEVMRMLKEGDTGKEYEAGKAMIKKITAEVERRQQARMQP